MYKLFVFFLGITFTFAQDATSESRQLSETEIDSTFSAEVKSKYDIDFEVYRGYSYADKAGSHLILMTEKRTKKRSTSFRKENLKVYNDSIKAYFFDINNEQLELKRTVTDFIINRGFLPEYSITYWTKFFTLNDYDGNGTIDPILVYSTYGMNGTDDGRIKIIILQNNQKIAIRHQNGVLDGERHTQVDAAFYELPKAIQQQVVTQMEAIMENNNGIFPSEWQEQMKAKKLKLND